MEPKPAKHNPKLKKKPQTKTLGGLIFFGGFVNLRNRKGKMASSIVFFRIVNLHQKANEQEGKRNYIEQLKFKKK